MAIKKIIKQNKPDWKFPEFDPDKFKPPKPPAKHPPDKNEPAPPLSSPEKFPDLFPKHIEPPRPWPKKDEDDPSFPLKEKNKGDRGQRW